MLKKILTAALSLSVLAGAGAASAYDHDHDGWKHERHEWREHDRDGWRDHGRGWGHGYGPPGQYRHAWRRGERWPHPYGYRTYYVGNPYYYHLRPAPRGYYWVRDGGDFMLVAIASGVIADVVINGGY